MNGEPTRILLVHQGFELYGSDRTFIQCCAIIREDFPAADILVLLPKLGPLHARLEAMGFRVAIDDMIVLRKSDGGFRILRCLARLPAALSRARTRFRAHDLVYVNTSVVLDYILLARAFSRKTIIHVHEIPTGIVAFAFRWLLRRSRSTIVFNSPATARAFHIGGARSFVVENGCAGPGRAELPPPDSVGPLHGLVLGRINTWKGQSLAVEAVSQLNARGGRPVRLRIVGGVFGNQTADRALQALISKLGVELDVQVLPFQDDPAPHYHWAHVVIVPSRKPEPFGLVAIEGMAHARPVIAAGHGGVADIVVDGVTGLTFKPGDARALASAMARYIDDRSSATAMGAAGRLRFEKRYTEEVMVRAFRDVLQHWRQFASAPRVPAAVALRCPATPVVLAVHQGYELYGSDRSFIDALETIRSILPTSKVMVHLSRNGPLAAALRERDFTVETRPVWVFRRFYSVAGQAFRFLALPLYIVRAAASMRKADIVYLNTSVLVGHLLSAVAHPRAICHVREIAPPAARWGMRKLLQWSRCGLIFNSAATMEALRIEPGPRSRVVHNGFGTCSATPPSDYDGERPLRLLFVGRFNDWKGQDLLAKAVAALGPDRRRVFLRFLGGDFEQSGFCEALKRDLTELGLDGHAAVFEFAADTVQHYAWSDVVVVPSTRPEPLGRVAIEGASHGRAVIFATHGGLLEVVEDSVSGIGVPPNDVRALTEAIRGMLRSPERVRRYGDAGREIYAQRFTTASFSAAFSDAWRSMLAG